jgi:SprB repeat
MPGGNTTASDTALAAGTYTVIITDIAHDSLFTMITITQPVPLSLNIASYTNVSCPGGSNGKATLAASGGTPPFKYLWPGGDTLASDSNLSAGNYPVSVVDSNHCIANTTVHIGVNSTLTANISTTNVSCFGMLNGQAIAAALGGISPYQYLWQPIGYTIPTAAGLSAGTYTAQITDALGCITFNTVTLTQPAPLAVSATVTDSVVNALVSGGTAPYTYQWLPGGSTNAFVSGLSAGTYTLIVSDSNLCTYTAVVMSPYNSILFTIWPPSLGPCGNPTYVTVAVLVSADTTEILNNCLLNIFYTGGEFAGDSLSNGGVIVTEGRQFQPASGNDYNIFDSSQIADNVIRISLGDTSFTSPDGTTLYSRYRDTLFLVKLRVQNSCDTGTVGFDLSYPSNFAYYTLNDTLNETYYDTLGFDTVPYTCDPYACLSSDGSYDSTCYYICYDTVWIIDTYTLHVDTSIDIYTSSVYNPSYRTYGGCYPYINWNYTDPINAGTNAKSIAAIGSIPENSSILTIPGYGFGSQKGHINVGNADGPGTITLDSMDILYWSEYLIKVKMPSYMLADTNHSITPTTPGSGPFTVYNACGNSVSNNLQINYNIENAYCPHYIKVRPNIVMVNEAESFNFECDTSISHHPAAFACVKKAIRTWNCYTGVNWKLSNDTNIALDTTLRDGISDIYFSYSNANFPSSSTLMVTLQQILPDCPTSIGDSVAFYDEADIKIRLNRYLPSGKSWSYDTTNNIVVGNYDYFYDAILHELGHAHGLGHVNDTLSLMYRVQLHTHRDSITSGSTYPGPATLLGGLDMVYTSADITPSFFGCSIYNILITDSVQCNDATLSVANIPENTYNLNLYPNPINSGDLTIAYQLNADSYIQFKIIDCIGREVIVLQYEHKMPGIYKQQVNINAIARGPYLFVANINGEIQTIKFIKI